MLARREEMREAKALSCLLFALLMFLASACGGGTSGTDNGGYTKISGSVRTTLGEPVSAAAVTVEESGDFDLTDQNGQFELLTVLQTREVTLLIERDQLQVSTTISDLPEKPKQIEVQMAIDLEQGIVGIVETEIKARPTPKPSLSPTATPSSIATPNPNPSGEMFPSASPSSEPTQQPTSQPSPASSGSGDPTASSSPSPTPAHTAPVTVSLTIKELGYIMPFTFLNLSSGPVFFSGDERSATLTRVYPYGTSNVVLPLKDPYYSSFSTGNSLDIWIDSIAQGTSAIDIELATKVNFSTTLPYPPTYAYQIEHFNVTTTATTPPTLTINPNVSNITGGTSYSSFANGVRVVSNLTFAPATLRNNVSLQHANIPGHLGAFTYWSPDGTQFGTVLNPKKKAPSAISLELFFNNQYETSIDVVGIPESSAVVEIDLHVSKSDPSGPLTAQIVQQQVTTW